MGQHETMNAVPKWMEEASVEQAVEITQEEIISQKCGRHRCNARISLNSDPRRMFCSSNCKTLARRDRLPELHKEKDRKYRANNLEQCKQKDRKYKKEHLEEGREKCRRWYRENRKKLLHDPVLFAQNRADKAAKMRRYRAAKKAAQNADS